MHGDRVLVTSGICLTKARLRGAGQILFRTNDEVDAFLKSINFLEDAPFQRIMLAVLFGLKNEDTPHCDRVDKKHGELPARIEVDITHIRGKPVAQARRRLLLTLLLALIDIGEKYGLPTNDLRQWRDEVVNEQLIYDEPNEDDTADEAT